MNTLVCDVVIPVYNEEQQLRDSVLKLRNFLKDNLKIPWQIIIADNGSTDGTLKLAQELGKECPEVKGIHIEQKGRGRALRRVWLESQSDIVSYMDVDLSTDLSAFPPLIGAIVQGYDIAIGSRLSSGAKVKRSLKREIASRVYNIIIKLIHQTHFSDAQCGFKAISRKAAQDLLPLVKDNEWFFDTELLILAGKKGYRIKEIPVKWVEDPGSTVKVLRTAYKDIKGLLRLKFSPALKKRNMKR